MAHLETPTDYKQEEAFFDELARDVTVTKMTDENLARYRNPSHPELYEREMLFSLVGDATGLKILEFGCGDGEAAVQMACYGAEVTGIDISAGAVKIARERARLQGVEPRFIVANLVADEQIGAARYDVVFCNGILHHVTADIDDVMVKLHRALKPGGLFVAREPVAYASWLTWLRRITPVKVSATEGEQPLRATEFRAIRKLFPELKTRYYRGFSRISRLTHCAPIVRAAAWLDSFLFRIPGAHCLAAIVVMQARKAN